MGTVIDHLFETVLDYLDSVGLLASLVNRFHLRSDRPTAAQIRLWDRVLVRMSQILDPVLAHRLGKSVLLVCTAGTSTEMESKSSLPTPSANAL